MQITKASETSKPRLFLLSLSILTFEEVHYRSDHRGSKLRYRKDCNIKSNCLCSHLGGP